MGPSARLKYLRICRSLYGLQRCLLRWYRRVYDMLELLILLLTRL